MKRSVFLYACLAILFAATAVYQVARAKYLFPQWFHQAHAVERPFALDSTPQGFTVGWISSWALKAGIQSGDILKSINGKPVTGLTVFGQAIINERPGDVLEITVQRQRAHKLLPERTFSLTIPQAGTRRGSATLLTWLFFVISPIFCLALGFWVAAVRIRDPLAWLLLALMLWFAAMADPGVEFWKPSLASFGAGYYAALGSTWPIWMLLFGIYFPEPFPRDSWWPRWKWVRWPIVTPLAFFAVIHTINSVGAVKNYASVKLLLSLETALGPVSAAFSVAGVASFFICIAFKIRMAISSDARRRLRLLYTGTEISLTPLFVLSIITWLNGWVFGSHFPNWLWLTTFALVFLFPLTLAYVIVVERAMDVRVVIRQGLRYAFAKSGVNAIRIGFGAGSIALVIFILRHVRPYSLSFFLIIGAAVFVFVMTRQAFRKLRLWIDRKFFRDAYHAEKILSELGDQVRSIIEPRPLLETVCRSIADSLHVPQVAALIGGDGFYRPAYAVGYDSLPDVAFPQDATTVRQLCEQKEPAGIYFDDPNSWIYRAPGLTEEERAKLAALRAELLLPLTSRDELLGFITLGQKRSEEPYSGADLRLLKSVAAQTGLALKNAQLTAAVARETAQRERLNRELEIAREVQERLFPQKLPAIRDLDYYGHCRPVLGVGGDYYDFLALPEGQLGVALGDVSGKGIAAALMMASLQASLRGEVAHADGNLTRLVSNVNRMIYEASSMNRYATFFYAQYEPHTRRLTYVNAGHNPPMLFHWRGGEWQLERLETGGTVVGLIEHAAYEQESVMLEDRSILIAFTDGVTEAMNCDNEEWGEERLRATVESAGTLSAREIVNHILCGVDQFTEGAPQHDDMTLVVLRCT
jgi:sigma-B regulation protein RsbU (phosphoserine phosphatase)